MHYKNSIDLASVCAVITAKRSECIACMQITMLQCAMCMVVCRYGLAFIWGFYSLTDHSKHFNLCTVFIAHSLPTVNQTCLWTVRRYLGTQTETTWAQGQHAVSTLEGQTQNTCFCEGAVLTTAPPRRIISFIDLLCLSTISRSVSCIHDSLVAFL